MAIFHPEFKKSRPGKWPFSTRNFTNQVLGNCQFPGWNLPWKMAIFHAWDFKIFSCECEVILPKKLPHGNFYRYPVEMIEN